MYASLRTNSMIFCTAQIAFLQIPRYLITHVTQFFAEKHGNSALSSRVLRFLQDVAIQRNADWIATPCKKTQGSQSEISPRI